MGFYLLPKRLMHILNIICCLILPGVETHNLLLNRKKTINEEQVQYIHFLTYWFIYSIYSYIESSLLVHIIHYIPLYYELKLILFYWLYSDTFQGAGYIYFKFIEKNYARFDKQLCDLVQAKIPKQITSFFVFKKKNGNEHSNIKKTVSKQDLNCD